MQMLKSIGKKMINNALTQLLNIKLPIVQAGMVWVSGAKLAAASANAGCLGVIGAGSMKPELLKQHILKAQNLTNSSLAVNIPIMYKASAEQINTALECGIKIFITSAGSPKKFTKFLKEKGCIVIHVTSSPELAKKCEAAGVDAIIAEGFEAGGHNGRDEITTLALIPQVVASVNIPVIAAGGIASGQAILACLALGASAVQIGTRFINTVESSAHENFKQTIINAKATDTKLMLKSLVPVRLLKNKFYQEVQTLQDSGADNQALSELLGKGRAKAGMLDGDIEAGELEVGQVVGMITDSPTVASLVNQFKTEYDHALNFLQSRNSIV
jgi:enoyl-[acyl-carrier protein] reductase II